MLALDRFINFLAMDGNLGGGFDSQSHLVAPDVNNGDLDVVADENTLIALT